MLYCIVDILRPLGNLTKKSALPVLCFFFFFMFQDLNHDFSVIDEPLKEKGKSTYHFEPF